MGKQKQKTSTLSRIKIPPNGERITVRKRKLQIPDNPIIPYIEGDGIGRDIMRPTMKLVDAAVKKAYTGKRRISWMEIFAGEKAKKLYGEYLPAETIDTMRDYVVSLKGPLTTPVGEGIRSLNVTLRQVLDLYSCIRPVEYIKGVNAPVRNPEKMNIVIFRENTEDVYMGLEWAAGSKETKKIMQFLKKEFKIVLNPTTAIGLKPMSEFASKRLVRSAIEYTLKNGRQSITLVHKGNIMKYTEGAFMNWGYEVALQEYKGRFITEKELNDKYKGIQPANKLVIKDRIADNMFQQVLTRPEDFDVVALPNLNGDYLSDACAAQVGGLGMAPGGNIGDSTACFEATHGTAPKHAGLNKANPSSLILSAVMMLKYLGWNEAAVLIRYGLERTILAKSVTYDLARMLNVKPIMTTDYVENIIRNL